MLGRPFASGATGMLGCIRTPGFHGRHADSNYHHEGADTRDKINVRELKEYAGQLARILLRLSHVPPQEWPDNPQTQQTVSARVEAERGQVIRVY